MDVQNDVRMYEGTDGRRIAPFYFPATAQLKPENCIKRDKGTADHMMPLGNWFVFVFVVVVLWLS